MARRVLPALLPAAALLVAVPVLATISTEPTCCYCQTGGPQVAFCAVLDSPSQEAEALARCQSENGTLLCLAMMRGHPSMATCGAQLAEQEVFCPIANGAPAASGAGLAVLLLALPALGVAALRARAAA